MKWPYFQNTLGRSLSHLQFFDDASRGPWGSLTFLWHLRGRTFVASVGAITTIAAMELEPSAQQLLRFPIRTVVLEKGGATMLKADHWNSTMFESTLFSASQDMFGSDYSSRFYFWPRSFLETQSSIISGFSGGAIPSIPFHCPVSECRWQNYSSIGVCASCSQKIVKTQDTSFYNCSSKPASVPQINCTYTPEDERFLSVTALIVDLETLDSTTFFQAAAQNFSKKDFSSLLGFIAVKPLGNMFYDMDNGTATKAPNDTEVTTCSMELCVHTYRNVFVRNGRLESENYTTELPPKPNRFETQGPFAQDWDPDPTFGVYGVEDPVSNVSGTYHVSSRALSNWQRYFSEFFTMHLGGSGETEGGSEVRRNDVLSTAAFYLYTSNISQVMDNVARTVTHLMRSEDNYNATQTFGDTYVTEVYIHVNWIWIAAPLLITTLSVLLLVMSISQSSSNFVPKSSALAFHFQGLHGWPEEELNDRIPARETPESLYAIAKEMRAQFNRGDDGRLGFSRTP